MDYRYFKKLDYTNDTDVMGRRLKEFREIFGVSINELSKIVGCSPKTIKNIEDGATPKRIHVNAIGMAISILINIEKNNSEVMDKVLDILRQEGVF